MALDDRTAKDRDIRALFLTAWGILFMCAALRHAVFRSTAFDLGIFDQALWQLSHGRGMRVSLVSMNIFSDHGAFILYPLSFLYKFVASPYLLFGVQSLALSLGIYTLGALGRYEGLTRTQQFLVAGVYILHPVVFNTNLFDFHPETLGAPLLPLVFLLAQQRRYALLACVCITILICKEVLALTVAGVGCVLMLRGARFIGATILVGALSWFLIVTQIIMPGLPDGADPNAFARYAYLGDSFTEKLTTLFLRPSVVLSHIEPLQVTAYGLALAVPCFWVFSRGSIVCLVALAPAFILNALSTLEFQRSLRFQYSLPLIPLFGVMAILTLKSGRLPYWFSLRRAFVWSLLVAGSLLVGRNIYSFGMYPVQWSPRGAVAPLCEAVALVPAEASVLASSRILPHLSHRVGLGLVSLSGQEVKPTQYDYVVVEPIGAADPHENELNASVSIALQGNSEYEIVFEKPEVIVFRRH